jgi:hypothetical membrane protein
MVVGVASALTLDLAILASIALSPWFSFYNNELSDLGNTQTNGTAAFVFDIGLVLAGLLMLAFAVLVSFRMPDHRVLVWAIPLAVTAVDLALIGVFPENLPGPVHRVISGVLFLMVSVTLLAFGSSSWALGSRRVGSIALVFGLFNAFIWVTTWPWSGVVNQWSVWPWGGVSIQESLTAAMLSTWLIIVALKMTSFPQAPASGAPGLN